MYPLPILRVLGGNDFSLLGFLRIGSCTCTQQTGFRQQRVRSPFNPFLAPAHSVVTELTHTGQETRTPLQKKSSQEKVTFHFVRVQPFLELTCCRSVSFLLGIYCALLCLMPLPMPLATLRHDGAVLLDLQEAAHCETETVREVLLSRKSARAFRAARFSRLPCLRTLSLLRRTLRTVPCMAVQHQDQTRDPAALLLSVPAPRASYLSPFCCHTIRARVFPPDSL